MQAFCDVYHDETQAIIKQFAPYDRPIAANDPQGLEKALGGLAVSFQAIGDLGVMFDKMDKVAPEDIEPDVAAVRDNWKAMQGTLNDEAGNALNPGGLLGDLGRGLLLALEGNGSWNRVNNYIVRNCGV